jgi:hypothetical protein
MIGQRRSIMPRKPNYRFERFERDRTRAAKKAARAQAKADKKAKASEVPSDRDSASERAAPSADDDATSD